MVQVVRTILTSYILVLLGSDSSLVLYKNDLYELFLLNGKRTSLSGGKSWYFWISRLGRNRLLLTLTKGDSWKRHRRILDPPFPNKFSSGRL